MFAQRTGRVAVTQVVSRNWPPKRCKSGITRSAAVQLRMTEWMSAAMVSGRVAAVMGMAAGGTGGSSRGRG